MERELNINNMNVLAVKNMIGLHNKARHERTKRHKDNLITVKELQSEKPKAEEKVNVEAVSEIFERLEYMTMIGGDCF